ncbi:hypothetical protein BaRGS_00039224 [Batillaria attramentaria]|uniref:Uncharacterized protein n=1 Tax=Batillaria attramentaria TaxID=370345 RepID=A0ABD0J4A1_9CAEN
MQVVEETVDYFCAVQTKRRQTMPSSGRDGWLLLCGSDKEETTMQVVEETDERQQEDKLDATGRMPTRRQTGCNRMNASKLINWMQQDERQQEDKLDATG